MQCSRTIHCTRKEFDKPRSVEGCRLLKVFRGKTNIGPVIDTFVSEHQGLTCTKNSGIDRIAGRGYCMDARKQKSYAIGTSNQRV